MERPSALFPPPGLSALLDGGQIALFLDFDGTLVDIAHAPDAINVADGLARRLEALSARLTGALALVTGRSVDNLVSFTGPVQLHIAGSHGGHVITENGSTLRDVDVLPDAVGRQMGRFARENELLYERKAHGAALHYRAMPMLEDKARLFAADLAREHGLETKSGKCVIEIVRPGTNKGAAVELLCQHPPFRGATPIFIGDDVTDEDGFTAANRLGGFGIVVGDRGNTAARYRLSNVKDVHAWLNL